MLLDKFREKKNVNEPKEEVSTHDVRNLIKLEEEQNEESNLIKNIEKNNVHGKSFLERPEGGDILDRILSIENRLASFDTMLYTLKEHVKEINENMKNMVSMYEFISNQVNPFVESTKIKSNEKNIISEKIESNEKVMQQEFLSGPRLSKVEPTFTSDIILMKWIESMCKKVGKENLPRLLEYYVDLNWISDEILTLLLTYSKGIGITAEQSENKRFTDLLSTDHMKSLLFIEKLRGNKIDENLLISLDNEMNKIKTRTGEI